MQDGPAVGALVGRAEGDIYVSEAFATVFGGGAGTPSWLATPRLKAKARVPKSTDCPPRGRKNFHGKHCSAAAVDSVVFNRERDLDSFEEAPPSEDYRAAGRPLARKEEPRGTRRCGLVDTFSSHGVLSAFAPGAAQDLATARSQMTSEFSDRAGCASGRSKGWDFVANIEDSGAVGGGPHRQGKKPLRRAGSAASCSSGGGAGRRRGKQVCPGHLLGLSTSEFAAMSVGEDAWKAWSSEVHHADQDSTAGLSTHTLNKKLFRGRGLTTPGVAPGRGAGRPPRGELSRTCELAGLPPEGHRWQQSARPWDSWGVRGERHLTPRDFEGCSPSMSGYSTPLSCEGGQRSRSAPPGGYGGGW